MEGTAASTYNTGSYEFLHVSSVNGKPGGPSLNSKVNWYGEGWLLVTAT